MILFFTLVFVGIIVLMITTKPTGSQAIKNVTGDGTWFVGTLLGQ